MLTRLAEYPIVQGLLQFVFPPLCGGCDEYTEQFGSICERCAAKIDWYTSPFELMIEPADSETQPPATGSLVFPLFAGGDYVDPLKRIVIHFKFHGVRSLGRSIARHVADTYRDKLDALKPFVLVPIPLHPGREYVRGYNQAQVFAEMLAGQLDVETSNGLLIRHTKRTPQARLKQAEREKNIRGVFAVSEPPDSDASRIVLVDDVVTSGSTVREARRVLVEAGYRVVGAISMAHGV